MSDLKDVLYNALLNEEDVAAALEEAKAQLKEEASAAEREMKGKSLRRQLALAQVDYELFLDNEENISVEEYEKKVEQHIEMIKNMETLVENMSSVWQEVEDMLNPAEYPAEYKSSSSATHDPDLKTLIFNELKSSY